MDNTTFKTRFKDAEWCISNVKITVGGAGGIGSWASLFLTRAGYDCIVHDFDTIESHNLGGQFFKTSQIGETKLGALSDNLHSFCGDNQNLYSHREMNQKTKVSYYCISAFDNMKARRDMFLAWVDLVNTLNKEDLNKVKPIFIDGRLLMETLQVYCVTPENASEYYTQHIFSDSEVEAEPCTLKQTSHTAAMIGTIITSFFTNHISNLTADMVFCKVPFFTKILTKLWFITHKTN